MHIRQKYDIAGQRLPLACKSVHPVVFRLTFDADKRISFIPGSLLITRLKAKLIIQYFE